MTHAFAGGDTTMRDDPDPGSSRPRGPAPRRLPPAGDRPLRRPAFALGRSGAARPRAALAGLLLAAASSALASPAAAQSTDPVWSTTMTVGESTRGTARGYATGDWPYGALETASVTWNSTSYTIESLHISDPEGVSVNDFIYLGFTGTFPRTTGLVLEFAGGVMPLDDAVGSGGRFQWGATHATTYPSGDFGGLSADDEVIVCLRTATQVCPGGNNPATGAPAVAGEAYVGRTLTAGPGDIADADGLTSPGYSYVWTRVDDDGESNPAQVGTAGTYVLAAADEGKKIKLTANFTDDGSESETRDVLFPSVGTVDPTPGSDVVWATTMTVAEASSDARGFDQQDGFGALVDSTFTAGTLSHEVEAMFVGPHNGTGYVAADDWVVFQLDIRLANSALADPDDYTLEFAGGAFPLSDATEDTDAVRQLLSFTKAWVASNASPLSETNYEATIPDGGTVNVLLRENPALPELEFDAATFNVAEDADSVEVKVKLSAAHTAEVTVDYATSDNTAIAGQDYTSRSGTLTFDPGDTEKTFHVPITDDAVYEPTQRFVVTLSDPSNADLGTQGSVAQVLITSDDAVPTASLADVSVGEGDGTMTLTLALSHLSEVATTYSTSTALVGGTATAGTDYTTFVPGTGLDFTVPAGDMSATLDITITDDAAPEADETITVSWALSGSDATPASLSFTGTITDNDPVVVGYDPVTYSVDEDDASVTLTLKVLDPATGGTPRAFVVSVSTHDITAENLGGSGDYEGITNQLVQFNAGETDQIHSITIIDDGVDEDDETFGSAVTVFSGLADVKEEAGTATVTIVDNDGSTNNAATGAPAVSGAAYVGETLTAGPGDIADADGLTTPGYSYVWTRVDDDGESNPAQVGTAGTYTLVAADEGKKIKLEANFTDDGSESETRDVLFPSVGTVDPTPGSDVVWATTMTVGEGSKGARGYNADLDAEHQFGSVDDASFSVGTLDHFAGAFFAGPHDGRTEATEWVVLELNTTPGSGKSALAEPDSYTLEFADEAFPLSDATTPTFTSRQRFAFTKAWVASNASPLSETSYEATIPDGATVNVLLRRTNNAAEGKPVITDPAQVDMELTADTDDIDDDDGLNDVSYDYQWIRYDSDGTSNPDTLSMQTSSTYTLTSADLGKTLRVEVTFEDDADNPETLTSDATNPVVPAAAACGSDELWCAQLEVGYTEPDMDGEFDLGFRDATNGYGTLSDSTFTHNSVDYDVTGVWAPDENGTKTLGFATSPNLPADGAGLTLHLQTLTGENALPLADYTLHANGNWQIEEALFADDLDDLTMLRSFDQSQGDYTRQTDEGTVFRVRLSAASGTPELEFDQINVNVDEDAGSVGLKVNLSAAQTAAVTVSYATSDNTAVAGEDYTSTSGMLTFDPGDTEQTITVPILDDQSYGNLKRFNVELSNASGADLGTDALARVTISNDEAVPTATIEDVSVAESAGTMTLTLRLSHPSELNTRAATDNASVGGTATEGTDYESFITGSNRFFTVPAGDLSATLDITIHDDNAVESDETITIAWDLSATNATPGVIAFTGTILDDDTASEVVELLDATLTVGNTGQRNSGFGCSSTSDYECGDAMSDHTFSSTDALGVTREFTINVLSTFIPQGGEYQGKKNLFFVVDRSSPLSDYENHHLVLVLDGRQFPFRGTDSAVDAVLNKVWYDTGLSWSLGQTVEVQILDMADPPLTRSPWLAVADAEAHEADGFIEFPVTLNRPPQQQVHYSATVDYETSSGTAIAGADFHHTTGTLRFAADETEQTVRVPLIDDNVEDDGETFTLTLSDPERATIADQYATGTIRNSELPVLSVADASATEGSAVVFTVSLSRTSTQEVTVAYATSGAMATSGTDFTAASGTLTFAAGDSSKTVSVATTDDSDHENDETFTLQLSSPTGATLGDATATGTINDNDDAPPPLTAEFQNVPAAHDGATAFTVRIAFSEPLKAGGSGTKLGRALVLTGATRGVVRRADGQSTDLYQFEVRPSGTDTITIALPETTDCAAADALCTGDGRPLSHPLSATVAGPATTPTMSVSDASATEGSAVVFTVSLSAATSEQVTVAYATSGGSATSGTDFTAASGTLAFAANETSKTVSVATTDDSDDEDDETFTLTLSSPANATLADATATGTINDNDAPVPLTAEFQNVPDTHDGATAFTVRIAFSEPLKAGGSGTKLGRALVLTGATRGVVRRADGQSTDLYQFEVRPSGTDTITIALPETTDCAAADALCTGDGRPLSHALTATVAYAAPSSSTAGDAANGDMQDDGVDDALALLDGVSADEAAAALLGEGGLSEAQLTALDRLGNGNGGFDLGDVLSWRDRCQRGEADCGGTAGDAGPLGAAVLLLAAVRGRRTSGRTGGRAPKPRARTRVRGARRRAKYTVGVLLAATAAWSCMDGPVAPAAPAAAVPDPGFLTVELAAPAAHRDIGVLLELEGPGIEAVRAPGLEVYESAASRRHRVILAGSLGAGPLMQFRVPDRNRLALYRVRVIQVTGEDYGLRDAGEYRAVLRY